MKKNAAASVPLGGISWEGGADSFIHKGTNGRWKDVLSEAESANYERILVFNDIIPGQTPVWKLEKKT